ncbi:MAG: pyruvate ferredoxin oxidoreductase, partial [Syntrophobacterales bacterium]
LDTNNPCAFGSLVTPDAYMEMRHSIAEGMEAALDLLPEVEERFAGIFDRRWAAIEPVECDDAEIILVTSGTVTSTCRELIEALRKRGEKVGLLKIKLFRPFPVEAIRRILAPAKKVAVIDRNFSFGASGIFAQEIRAALCNCPGHPPVFGFVAGIGGRDITKDVLEGIYRQTQLSDRPEREDIWIGLKEVHGAAEHS